MQECNAARCPEPTRAQGTARTGWLTLLVFVAARSLSNWPFLNTGPSPVRLHLHGTRRHHCEDSCMHIAQGPDRSEAPKRRGAPYGARREGKLSASARLYQPLKGEGIDLGEECRRWQIFCHVPSGNQPTTPLCRSTSVGALALAALIVSCGHHNSPTPPANPPPFNKTWKANKS